MSSSREKIYQDKNLLILFSVTLMAIMGVASLTPAFPKIGQQLGVSPKQIGLLITWFTLPGVFLTPVLGILADRWGRKRILVPSLFLFGMAGVACAFSKSYNLLLFFRFLQGIGAASLGSLNVTIIGDLFSGKNRPAAMGYNASVLSIGTASYPIMGGGLATLGWNYPFFLPALAVPVGLTVLFFMRNPEPTEKPELKTYFRETVKSLKKRRIIGLFLVSIFTFIILYGSYLTYFPFLIGQSFGKPPLMIGLIMSSMSLTTATASSQLGRLSKHFSEPNLLLIAFSLTGFAMVLVPHLGSVWLLFIPAIFFGMGHGINIPTIQTVLAEMAPINQRAAIMSLNGMVLRIGQTLGPLLMGLVFVAFNIQGVFYAGALVAVLTLICIIWLVK